jgi:hypothetical protein
MKLRILRSYGMVISRLGYKVLQVAVFIMTQVRAVHASSREFFRHRLP